MSVNRSEARGDDDSPVSYRSHRVGGVDARPAIDGLPLAVRAVIALPGFLLMAWMSAARRRRGDVPIVSSSYWRNRFG